MYKTKEIRWFFKQEIPHVRTWFRALRFDNFEQRVDYYLHLKNEDVGVKLREGNIEIKHRIGQREQSCLNLEATGYFEHWIKWSFAGKDNDPLYAQVYKGNYDTWIKVAKERLSVQLAQKNGKTTIHSPSDTLDHGCQVEYSMVHTMGKKWYTFGLEWFGENMLDLEPEFISEILGDTTLTLKESMGYAALLSKQYNLKG